MQRQSCSGDISEVIIHDAPEVIIHVTEDVVHVMSGIGDVVVEDVVVELEP